MGFFRALAATTPSPSHRQRVIPLPQVTCSPYPLPQAMHLPYPLPQATRLPYPLPIPHALPLTPNASVSAAPAFAPLPTLSQILARCAEMRPMMCRRGAFEGARAWPFLPAADLQHCGSYPKALGQVSLQLCMSPNLRNSSLFMTAPPEEPPAELLPPPVERKMPTC